MGATSSRPIPSSSTAAAPIIDARPVWLEEANYFFRLSAYQERLERLYAENRASASRSTFATRCSRGSARACATSASAARGRRGHPLRAIRAPHLRLVRRADELPDRRRVPGRPGVAGEVVAGGPSRDRQEHHPLPLPVLAGDAHERRAAAATQVFAHGFMLDIGGQRMSKTTGNTQDPDEAAATFGVDGVRYAVLAEVPSTATRTSPSTPSCGATTPTSPTTSATSSTAP